MKEREERVREADDKSEAEMAPPSPFRHTHDVKFIESRVRECGSDSNSNTAPFPVDRVMFSKVNEESCSVEDVDV